MKLVYFISFGAGVPFLVIDGGAAGVIVEDAVTDNSYMLSFLATSADGGEDLVLTSSRDVSLAEVSTNSNTEAAGVALEGARA